MLERRKNWNRLRNKEIQTGVDDRRGEKGRRPAVSGVGQSLRRYEEGRQKEVDVEAPNLGSSIGNGFMPDL